jgi:hypothetical protein
MRIALDPTGHRVPRTKPTCLLHTWRPNRQRPFALVLHLHQHESSRNLHLQYLAKNQSAQRCQSLITQGSDHPPVLEPHMVLSPRLHLAVHATMQPALDPAGHWVPRTKPTCLLHTWRPYRQRPFALVLHLHQHESRRNLHLQYLAKNQSTQRCQSPITQGSDHPPVLEPHTVLNLPLNDCIDNTHMK